MLPLVMYELKKNIERDFMIWESKSYNEHPLLNRADGEIMKFRQYCTQFYPGRPDGEAGESRQDANRHR